MLEIDRPRFVAAMQQLCVVHDRRLDADGMAKLIASYWGALAKMNIDVLEQSVAKSVETGDRFPRPATLWGLSKDVRRRAFEVKETPPAGDSLYGWANRVMFAWLWRRVNRYGVLSEEQLQRVIRMKNDELAALRALIADKDPEATGKRFIDRFEQRADTIAEMRAAA